MLKCVCFYFDFFLSLPNEIIESKKREKRKEITKCTKILTEKIKYQQGKLNEKERERETMMNEKYYI